MKTTCLFRVLAVLFAMLLALIILLADMGLASEVFDVVYDFPYGDKIAHFLLMGTLSMLVSLGFTVRRVRVLGIPLLIGSLFLAALATVEEASQFFFSNRSLTLFDLLANYLGIFIFGEIGALLHRLFNRPAAQPGKEQR